MEVQAYSMKHNKSKEENYKKFIEMMDLRLKYPKDASLHVRFKPEKEDRLILYWAGKPINKIGTHEEAYKQTQNYGIYKIEKQKDVTLKMECPCIYYYENELIPRHIHYVYSNKEQTKWNPKIYTKAIICPISQKEVKRHLKMKTGILILENEKEEKIKNIEFPIIVKGSTQKKSQDIGYELIKKGFKNVRFLLD